jgi:glycosyltransferase involved in cell wall biosynthesis
MNSHRPKTIRSISKKFDSHNKILTNAINKNAKKTLADHKKKTTMAVKIAGEYGLIQREIKRNPIPTEMIKKVGEYGFINKPIINKTESPKFSIIISAFNSENFIEECLNSIQNQTCLNDTNYEILLGIDNCEKTLEKIKKIMKNYRNLRVFYMSSNKGTYITFNTLIEQCKFENIIRFDSDDIMDDKLIEEVSKHVNENDIIRFRYVNFTGNLSKDASEIKEMQDIAQGAVLIKKYIFDAIGGYQPWLCAADYDLLQRLKNVVKIFNVTKLVMYRRIHENCLTRKSSTAMRSDLRNYYHKQIELNKQNNVFKIERIMNTYEEIL